MGAKSLLAQLQSLLVVLSDTGLDQLHNLIKIYYSLLVRGETRALSDHLSHQTGSLAQSTFSQDRSFTDRCDLCGDETFVKPNC